MNKLALKLPNDKKNTDKMGALVKVGKETSQREHIIRCAGLITEINDNGESLIEFCKKNN